MKTKIVRLIEVAILLIGIPLAASAASNSNSIIEDNIEYYIQTDKAIYELGENIEMLYKVTNLGDEDVSISCSRGGAFNLWVQKDDETIWALAHSFLWYLQNIDLLAGESVEIPYSWDMIDDDSDLVGPGVYDIVGVMYNEPWNEYNHGTYTITEVEVPITIIPEPATVLLLGLGGLIMKS